LEKIPYLSSAQAQTLHQAAKQSVASLRGETVEQLVRDLVTQVRHCEKAEQHRVRAQKAVTRQFA